MAITQIAEPCWTPSWEDDDRSEPLRSEGPHYLTADQVPTYSDGSNRAAFHKGCGGTVMFGLDGYCLRCEAEGLDGEDWEARTVVPRQLSAPCFEAECDECGYVYDEDGEGREHHLTEAGLREAVRDGYWTLVDDRLLCGECNGENERSLQRALAAVRPGGES